MAVKTIELTRRAFCTDVAATAVVAFPPFCATEDVHATGLKPLIKYRGGKAKEFAQYERFIPKDYETYYEPFVGGGAIFFKLMPRKAVIGDINEPLINFYREVRNRFEEQPNVFYDENEEMCAA